MGQSSPVKTYLYGGEVEIDFNPKGHKYTVNDGGKIFKPPSVTGITGVVDKSAPLKQWAVNVTMDAIRNAIHAGIAYPPDVLENIFTNAKKQHFFQKKAAADIGTNAHLWTQLYAMGKNPEIPKPELPYRPCVDAFLKFTEQHNVQFLDTERPVYSRKHKVSGRMDGKALVDGIMTLVDYKSGNGIYEEMQFQTAAYNMFYEEETGETIEQRLIIRLGKTDGHFYSLLLPRKTLKPDWKAFLGALALYKRIKEIKKTRQDTNTSKIDWLDG